MIRTLLAVMIVVLAGLTVTPAKAQQTDAGVEMVWVQIEAQPDLTRINEALRRRSAQLPNVNGFDLGSGWYGVALGPFSPDVANETLRQLRRDGAIPRDSYIARSSDYDRQIWPVGADFLTDEESAVVAGLQDQTQEQPVVQDVPEVEVIEVAPEPEPEPEIIDETPREARASEAALTRDQRADLQIALKWAGHYVGRIDAAFGGGTRRSMASWQEANGYDATGILTTLQRADLMDQYNAVLKGMGMTLVSDPQTGIQMQMPMGILAFKELEPPFAHYDETGDIPARALLISQEGTQETLYGLYDIMQTLRIVPPEGPRKRESDSFVLIGESATMVSHTEATLRNGQIKGFTLVWPAGDEERRTRILGLMQDSFTRIDGVLDPAAGYNESQSIDLVSGLEIRKPILSRSGFYVDRTGAVVTTSEGIGQCGNLTLDDIYNAEVTSVDEALGIAVLRPVQALSPMMIAAFQQGDARLNSDVTVAGYSYGGVLGAPSLTFGTVSDVKGLNGEAQLKRLTLNALDGDAGGPVLDAGGAVLGMLMPRNTDGRQLPDDVSFAINAQSLQTILRAAGITAATTPGGPALPPAELSDRASAMTVLVSCWE
ncbi:serine protease [Rhodobacteraceae bacterium KMM 6894]|nr:serine protease [Rhodobacteraceae bacterium KMM 6894]